MKNKEKEAGNGPFLCVNKPQSLKKISQRVGQTSLTVNHSGRVMISLAYPILWPVMRVIMMRCMSRAMRAANTFH